MGTVPHKTKRRSCRLTMWAGRASSLSRRCVQEKENSLDLLKEREKDAHVVATEKGEILFLFDRGGRWTVNVLLSQRLKRERG